MWTTGDDGRQRIAFCSDHEGRGQLYSAVIGKRAPATSRLARRTDGHFYARHASSDGRQVVYSAGGELFLLDSLDDGVEARPIDVRIGGARPALAPTRVKASAHLATISPDTDRPRVGGRGPRHVQWVTHRDGPVRALAAGSAVRRDCRSCSTTPGSRG